MKQEVKGSASLTAKRRRFSEEFRRGLVQKTLVPEASVAKIALEHRLNANLVFKWRRRYLRELARPRGDAATLLPVNIEQVSHAPHSRLLETVAPVPRRSGSAGSIEIELPAGRIRVKGAVDRATLRAVLQILSER